MKTILMIVAGSLMLIAPISGAIAQANAIGPKQDDPKALIVQGGRTDKLAIGPKQDDPRAKKPPQNNRSRGLTPNPND